MVLSRTDNQIDIIVITDLLENIQMIYDPETIKASLHSLRELFKQAHDLQCKLYDFDSSDYGVVGNQIGDLIGLMNQHEWDAQSVLKTAAHSELHTNGEVNLLAIGRPVPEGWENKVEEHLKTFIIK